MLKIMYVDSFSIQHLKYRVFHKPSIGFDETANYKISNNTLFSIDVKSVAVIFCVTTAHMLWAVEL